MQTVKQNLQYIQRSLSSGTHKEQTAILHLMMNETLEAVRNKSFQYETAYSSDKNLNHMYTYICLSKKAKASILADLQELQILHSRKNDSKRCLAIVQKLLQNNLYQNEVNGVVNSWVNTSTSSTKTTPLSVK